MAEIALKGNMKVKTLKAEFKKAFGSTLRVYKSATCKGAFADEDATLASIRAEGAKGGELVVKGNMQVGNFEKKVAEMYGIGVQVASANDDELIDNNITLSKAATLSSGGQKKETKQSVAAKESKSTPVDKNTIKSLYDEVYEEEKIYLVKKNGKYGVLDKNGHVLIKPKYTGIDSRFYEGMLTTWGEGGVGYINEKGEEVVPCIYQSSQKFSNGLAGVRRKGEKWGFINKQGKEVIPPTYDEIWEPFSEKGIAKVELNKEKFYIDTKGKKVKSILSSILGVLKK